MTADEFRAALAALGLTQRGFAHLIGAAERTVRHWCSGDRDIPETIRRVVNMLIAHPETAGWLRCDTEMGEHNPCSSKAA